MPRRDGTGPKGLGAMTGKKIGNCEKNGEKGKNLEFSTGKGNKGCGKRKGDGNRWNNVD